MNMILRLLDENKIISADNFLKESSFTTGKSKISILDISDFKKKGI